MTVESQIPYQSYTANGSQTSFALGFYVEDKGNFFVKKDDSVVNVNDYVYDSTTNSIRFNTAPPQDCLVEIERVTSVDRSTTYATFNNSFRPEVLNYDIDRIWRKLQELAYTDSVLFLKLIKEISDRIAVDTALQAQIDSLDDQVSLNTANVEQLINNLSQEIADRLQADTILKEMFLSIIDTAINEGTVNALAVMHVDTVGDLDLVQAWEGRTVHVRDFGEYSYNSETQEWEAHALPINYWKNRIDGYPINTRIMLNDGTIVQSLVSNNTTDPHSDMTGWSNFELETKKINYGNFAFDVRQIGVVADMETDWTSTILGFLSSVPENSTIYIPKGVKWNATHDSGSVYAVMANNCTLIDDSGYESRYTYSNQAERWQASQQIYYKTQDYGAAGRRNGNGLNVRSDYHPYYNIENDALWGTAGCRSSLVFRFNNAGANPDTAQFGADLTDSSKACVAVSSYGPYINGTKALRIGLQSSIAPHSFTFNSDLVQDVSYIFGKRLKRIAQGTPEDDPTWQSATHSVRWTQPLGHTGTFSQLWYKGSTLEHRQDLNTSGDLIWTPKTTGNGTMTYTNLNELGGHKKRVLTGTIGSSLSIIYSNGYVSNYGASGGQTVTLPTPTKGLHFEIGIDTAQNVRLVPASGTKFLGKTDAYYMESSTVASKLKITALDTTTWAWERTGTWVDQT
ncbi:phage tail fiber domain-containing protein [Acinetobacter zhairhuonensis]|uniref:phage tail fiber domain-containing protein n=1 Tax=Acinetobacter sp. A7.4 TaxID=2919921 RepID=UPI001F4F3C03|nr:phage tail fiber protein [Acinetobacter sp. A7.4]MCJ8163150.1 phage tail fiber protein [Acinetobacter sp. A7.4]